MAAEKFAPCMKQIRIRKSFGCFNRFAVECLICFYQFAALVKREAEREAEREIARYIYRTLSGRY